MKKILWISLVCLFGQSLKAQNCFSDFNYFQTITLSASSEQGSIASSTVAIPFDSKSLFDAGKLAEDGSDFRVTDANCDPIPFFIQGIAERSMNVLYVAVPTIDQQGLSLQLYYGSNEPQTSMIDGHQVFDFFDDFEDGEVDLDQWEVIGHFNDMLEETEGELQFTGTSGTPGIFKYTSPKVGYSEPVTFDFTANANNSYVYGIADTASIQRVGLRYETGAQSFDTLDIIALMADTNSGGFNPGIAYPLVQVPRNDLNIISITAFIDSDNKLNFTRFENYSTGDSNLDTLRVTQYDFQALRPFFASFGSAIRVEYLGIRPAVTAVPTMDYGEEMMINTTATSALDSRHLIKMYPNPAWQSIHFETTDTRPIKVSIFNLLGQNMASLPFEPTIEVNQLKPGTYMVRLEFEDGSVIAKKLEIINQ